MENLSQEHILLDLPKEHTLPQLLDLPKTPRRFHKTLCVSGPLVPRLLDLPKDMINEIVSLISFDEFAALRITSKYFREILEEKCG